MNKDIMLPLGRCIIKQYSIIKQSWEMYWNIVTYKGSWLKTPTS